MRSRVICCFVLFTSFVFVIILLTATYIDCDSGRTCLNFSRRRPGAFLSGGQGREERKLLWEWELSKATCRRKKTLLSWNPNNFYSAESIWGKDATFNTFITKLFVIQFLGHLKFCLFRYKMFASHIDSWILKKQTTAWSKGTAQY